MDVDQIYAGLETGFTKDHDSLANVPRIDTMYGEITREGVGTLMQHLSFHQKHFLDIGSGVGKAVIQIALETSVKSSTGYEILPSRYQVSRGAKERYDAQVTNSDSSDSSVHFILNEMKPNVSQFNHAALPLADYDIYYINNLLWMENTNRQLVEALLEAVVPGNVIILSKELPRLEEIATVSSLEVEMSWTKKYRLTIYTVR